MRHGIDRFDRFVLDLWLACMGLLCVLVQYGCGHRDPWSFLLWLLR